jgi:glycosyltransferase involved in cell wall biosynthesis
MEPLGLVGPASPWAGGVTSFTTALAEALRPRPLRWLSWRVPRRALPPGTHIEAGVEPPPGAEPALDVWRRSSWVVAGHRLRACPAVVLTLTHPAMLFPYRSLVAAYRRAGGRVVLLCHNVVAHEAWPGLRFMAREVLGLADAIVVHSRAEAELARSLRPCGPEVVEAFHPVYTDHARRAWPPRPRANRILAFGYVRPYKGLDDLIDALPLVPEAELEIVGRFMEPLDRLRRRARRLGVADRVHLVDGYVPEGRLRAVFARADAVVAPYRQASQSGAVHLAYSFGRPVVATTVGGLQEAVVEGETGAVCPSHDPPALAAALRRVLDAPAGAFDPGLRRVLATRGWDRYAALLEAAAAGRDHHPQEGPS